MGSSVAHVKSYFFDWKVFLFLQRTYYRYIAQRVNKVVFPTRRYDGPKAGSERDLTTLNQMDFVDYSDGVATVSFRKRTGSNALPYVRITWKSRRIIVIYQLSRWC